MSAKRRKWDRSEEWEVYPIPRRGEDEGPTEVPDVVGMHVDEAARLANAAGWLARAHGPGVVIFMDLVPGRLNLLFDVSRKVVEVSVG